jgi:dipeptidyl aminopeptidase/acylaminoacyl peptidase
MSMSGVREQRWPGVCRCGLRARSAIGLAASALALALPAAAQVDYSRAERLIGWHLEPLVLGFPSEPTWLEDGERFWYSVRSRAGLEFILVEPAAGQRRPAFDNARLAAAMSIAADTSYDPARLPFATFEFTRATSAIRFRVSGRRFDCDLASYACTVGDTTGDRPAHHLPSPDGRREAFIHRYDLWIRPASGGDSVRLTTDGEEYYRYGEASPRPSELRRRSRSTPWLEWSPDSRRIAVARHDERNIPLMPLYSSTTTRPTSYLYRYGLPGDTAVSRFDIHIVDVESRGNVRVDMAAQPYPMSGLAGLGPGNDWLTVKWSPAGDRLWFTHHVRARKRVQLMEADPATGRTLGILAKDSSATYVELNLLRNGKPNWFVLGGGAEVLWFSERDGWAHLYRYDASGKLLNPVTTGPWTVGEVVHIDERAGQVYFTARAREPGSNPYYRRLYRASLNGGTPVLLTPEDADHTVEFTRSGRFFLDRYSAPDQPGRTVLRAADGRVVRTLEEADVSQLAAQGWAPPEVITVKARDGTTDLRGLVFKPGNLDPARKYPVIVNIYPGPQIGSVGNWNFDVARRGENHGLAELGFIVVQVDALGTPYRWKAFHDAWYGNMGDNGIPDQIAAVRQLGARHAWMDLDRVGIYGHSGGGFSSTDALLRYPDFFKVAVSSSGNHDNRSYGHYWAEQYQGLLVRDTVKGADNYQNQVNALLVNNLKGHLFLMHGDMDDNVHPAMTLQVVDALIRANKSFDLLILPDRAHGLNEPYVIRRRWDYFVEHLLGQEPPRDFEIRQPATGR